MKTIKEAGKPFKVSVSARRYTEWQSRNNSYFMTMGGLYGLAIGADRTRTFTSKVEVNSDLCYGLKDRLEEVLKREGFEREERHRFNGYWGYVKSSAHKFASYDEAKLPGLVEEAKTSIKADLAKWVQETIDRYMEYRGNENYGTIWDDLDVDVPREQLHVEYLAWHKDA